MPDDKDKTRQSAEMRATTARMTLKGGTHSLTGAVRETWRDWQSDEAHEPAVLLTRDELLQQLAAANVDVTEGDLLYWQRKGVIPYPVVKRIGRTGYAY